jgi:hypothetical protein
MRPIDIACRHTDADGTNCEAQEGELCNKTSAYGQRYASSVPHTERVEDAAAMGDEDISLLLPV